MPKKSRSGLPMAMAKAKPRNKMPTTSPIRRAGLAGSMGSKKWPCNAPPMSPRITKAMPAVASAMTLRTNSFGLLYSECLSTVGDALIWLGVGSESEGWKLADGAAFECGLVGAKADAGPVGGLSGVGEGFAILDQGADKFMGEVRMRAAVAGALHEAEVRFLAEIIHAFGGEGLNGFGQAFGVVRRFDRFGDLRFRQFGGVHDERFM